jgi:hypothetical protein
MAVSDLLSGLVGAGGSFASAYLPYEATSAQMEAIKNITSQFPTKAAEVGQTAAQAAEFKPFAVKTGTGTTQVDVGGGYTQTLGAEPAEIQAGLFQQAQGLLGQQQPTAESLYQQFQAASAADQERQRLELENRLAAQGRLGVTTSAYGGTPEQLAMEKAIQEQSAKNMLTAQTLAPQLQQQQLANIQSALTGAYLPQAQELSALQQGAQLANIYQAAQQGASEALLGTGIAGLEAEAAGTGAIANLEAQRARALADALGGLFASSQGQPSTADIILEQLFG